MTLARNKIDIKKISSSEDLKFFYRLRNSHDYLKEVKQRKKKFSIFKKNFLIIGKNQTVYIIFYKKLRVGIFYINKKKYWGIIISKKFRKRKIATYVIKKVLKKHKNLKTLTNISNYFIIVILLKLGFKPIFMRNKTKIMWKSNKKFK